MFKGCGAFLGLMVFEGVKGVVSTAPACTCVLQPAPGFPMSAIVVCPKLEPREKILFTV